MSYTQFTVSIYCINPLQIGYYVGIYDIDMPKPTIPRLFRLANEYLQETATQKVCFYYCQDFVVL